MWLVNLIKTCYGWFDTSLRWLAPVADLIIRLWIAQVFFMAGLAKITTWQTTIFLFTHEHPVVFLSPPIAATLATGIELIIPLFLVLGLAGRTPSFILFVFNIMAVMSYPFLWTDAGAAGLKDHIYWGLLIMMLMTHGYGKLSLDYLLCRWWRRCKID